MSNPNIFALELLQSLNINHHNVTGFELVAKAGLAPELTLHRIMNADDVCGIRPVIEKYRLERK